MRETLDVHQMVQMLADAFEAGGSASAEKGGPRSVSVMNPARLQVYVDYGKDLFRFR